VTCAACGHENSATAKFCEECGALLAAAPPAQEQRKVVTVLFCDVTGSTALGEQLDPETLRALLARYFEAMKTIVERHGGTVEKFIGDAVMAIFGVPTLHEDDALRAARAAVEMRDALPELGIEGRIGVTTGEVVTGTAERLATGDAVNVAARLEQAAQPGEVLIGEATFRLIQELVDAEPVEPLSLKGKSEPVPAFRLRAVTGEPARRHQAPMVGRDRQLRQLADAFANVVDDGACHLFTVLGAAWRGQVAARGGVAGGARRDGRPRALPLVRRGDHALAGARGAAGARHPARGRAGGRCDRRRARRVRRAGADGRDRLGRPQGLRAGRARAAARRRVGRPALGRARLLRPG
jgi:class 3 adenylate cyclase